ncbi:MAG: GTPase ObgE [Fimbriimonadales bacterium]|nr:GTPase ObgE [Fimbriimonadales bacterium]
MFLDEAEVEFRSGRGGSGAVSFHREKHVPRGGPNGADGGRGGDVVLIADRGKRTLYDFQLQPKYAAEDGEHAKGNKKGRNGRPVVLKVPVGTVVSDLLSGEVLADLKAHGQRCVVCRGGRGGFGNLHYVSSVRQVPNFAEKGEPGRTVLAKLELKLLADIGLIGLPNAGKSTLISAISSAKPKIADYPFTTIVPNLGVVRAGDQTFVVADLPGLIPGASQGKGLGQRFLKHAERCKALVHVVECLPLDGSDPVANFEAIETELHAYDPELHARPRLIAVSKADLCRREAWQRLLDRFRATGHAVFGISAVTGQGIDALVYAMAEHALAEESEETAPPLAQSGQARMQQPDWEVLGAEDGVFVVRGDSVERMVAMTDLDNRDGLRHLHRRLVRMGVIDRLRELGCGEGDTVQIGEWEFAFSDEA